MELLNKIQQQLRVPKGQFNSFAKYHYRNAEDILEAVKPLLGDGILIVSDEIVEVGGWHYVKATATLYAKSTDAALFPEGTWTKATGWAREALDKKGMDEAQITGAASSYARKYALNGLFCIDDTKDADHDEAATKPMLTTASYTLPVPKPLIVQIEERKKKIKELCDRLSDVPLLDKGDYEGFVEKATGLKLEPDNYQDIIERLSA